MDGEQPIKLERTKQRVEATDVDMSGSIFSDVNLACAAFNNVKLAEATIHDANLSGMRISDANLSGASIVESNTATIAPAYRRNCRVGQPVSAELLDSLWLRHGVGYAGARIPRDQVYLRRKTRAAYQTGYFAGVLRLVGNPGQQHILERDSLARTKLDLAHSIHHRLDGPLAIDRHDLFADAVVGGIEADGQLGPHLWRLLGKALDSRHDAGSRDGHTARTQANLLHQQADGGHEVGKVEERLAHAHEDQVHTVAAHLYGVAIED